MNDDNDLLPASVRRQTQLLHNSIEPPMNIDKRWSFLLAIAARAAAGAAIASNTRRRHQRAAHNLDHKTQLKSWENEGGNLAPTPVAAILP